jgi:hypothetical protein
VPYNSDNSEPHLLLKSRRYQKAQLLSQTPDDEKIEFKCLQPIIVVTQPERNDCKATGGKGTAEAELPFGGKMRDCQIIPRSQISELMFCSKTLTSASHVEGNYDSDLRTVLHEASGAHRSN